MPQDPYAQIAQPSGGLPPSMQTGGDPYAEIAQSSAAPVTLNQRRGGFSGTIPPKPILESVGEVGAGALKNVWDVSAPIIGHRLLQRNGIAPPGDLYSGEGQLKDVPEKATLMMAGEMGEPDFLPESGIARPKPRVAAPNSSPDAAPGMIGRAGEVAVRRAGRIPGVQAAKDVNYILRGPGEPEASAPTPEIAKPAPIPETDGIPWGSGGKGPLELRGKRIPFTDPGAHLPEHPGVFPGASEPATPAPEVLQANSLLRGSQRITDPAEGLGRISSPGEAGSMVKSVEAPAPKIAPPNPARIGDLLNESLGGKIPEGHTAAASSSALESYKYDPATKEFEAVTKGGQHYVYGDVPQEAADKFINAPSKGKAWTELRSTPGVTQVAKVVNGQRVGTQPPVAIRSASPEDLSPEWSKSIPVVKAQKAARIAKPN